MANVGRNDPAYDAVEVTPSDTANLGAVRSLYIGGEGSVKVMTALGSTVTFSGVADGTILPVAVQMVFAEDTTATAIVALY